METLRNDMQTRLVKLESTCAALTRETEDGWFGKQVEGSESLHHTDRSLAIFVKLKFKNWNLSSEYFVSSPPSSGCGGVEAGLTHAGVHSPSV